jgi:hypothetical protein
MLLLRRAGRAIACVHFRISLHCNASSLGATFVRQVGRMDHK